MQGVHLLCWNLVPGGVQCAQLSTSLLGSSCAPQVCASGIGLSIDMTWLALQLHPCSLQCMHPATWSTTRPHCSGQLSQQPASTCLPQACCAHCWPVQLKCDIVLDASYNCLACMVVNTACH